LFCHVTSRVDGDADQSLLRDKGGRGFPYLVFMDEKGDVLAKQRDRSVEGFETTRAACMNFLALDKKLKAGDKSVAADLLIARIEMGGISHDDAKAAEADLGKISDKKREQIAKLMVNLEVSDVVSNIRTRKAAAEAGRNFKKMWDDNRVPTGQVAESFFLVIIETASADSDVKLFERAMAEYEKVARKGPRLERTLERMQKRLQEIKGS